ncbi:hypothetical protein, partial [Yersinia sp. 2542 StPb PI]|uniref:hypothetical protein n=1 Tax=Yersinia sp. 2542 StPb PI TaxID=3117408 RepID=UPI003B281BE0
LVVAIAEALFNLLVSLFSFLFSIILFVVEAIYSLSYGAKWIRILITVGVLNVIAGSIVFFAMI